MSLRSKFILLIALPVVACSSDSESSPKGTDAGTDAKPQADAKADSPADAPDAASACLSVDGIVLAVDTLYFGDMDWDGFVDPSAWMLFGSNLDGDDSTAASTGLCQPAAGATAEEIYPDGEDGVDNAFGRDVLPLLATASPDFSQRVNASIAEGFFTWLLKVDPFEAASSTFEVTTKVYAADSLPSLPNFDGSDCWPVAKASLSSTSDLESAKVAYSDGAIVSDRLHTGTPGDLELAVPLSGFVLRLTAHHASIVIDFEDDPNIPSKGMISGVLDTEEFIEQVRDLLGFLDPTMCSGPTFEAAATAIRKASDIMSDGTQDPSATCNGISMGLGFTVGKAGFSGLGSATPAPDPCP